MWALPYRYILTRHNISRQVWWLCKGFYTFLFLKILFIWPIAGDISAYRAFAFTSFFSQFIYAPLFIAQIEANVFFAVFAILLILGILLRINVFISILIFWFSISVTRYSLPIVNGSDLVLAQFLFLSIFFSYNGGNSRQRSSLHSVVTNAAFILARIQLLLIYIFSGYDKLISAEWRSGAAIYSISQLKFFNNPYFHVELGEEISKVIGWSVILFELSFPLLVWFRPLRITMLILGVAFHLAIAIVIGLIDFAPVMVICYALFLPTPGSPTEDVNFYPSDDS
ncbi:MAG: HTTM domain-containing protein [Cyclobacteriaceae bacterium]|nr:HTTM domain-containing protein [Cyclobacteriaceae bacterium]